MESQPSPIVATLLRGFRKRCPRCGVGQLFQRWYTLHERCSACRLEYERVEGNTWGFMYVSTAFLTGLFIVAMLLSTPPEIWLLRTLVLPLVLSVVLGTLPRRKGIALALEFLIDGRVNEQDATSVGPVAAKDEESSTSD